MDTGEGDEEPAVRDEADEQEAGEETVSGELEN
jgi:hypothetical protein